MFNEVELKEMAEEIDAKERKILGGDVNYSLEMSNEFGNAGKQGDFNIEGECFDHYLMH